MDDRERVVYILFLLVCIFQFSYTGGGLFVQLNHHSRTKGKRPFGFPSPPHLTLSFKVAPTWLFPTQGCGCLSALVARKSQLSFVSPIMSTTGPNTPTDALWVCAQDKVWVQTSCKMLLIWCSKLPQHRVLGRGRACL